MSAPIPRPPYFFERSYTQTAEPFDGLGPLYIRNSCQACHPGYGHGKRMERYRWDDWGNGYLLVVYDKSNDAYLSSLTGMPQTAAVEPFKAPLDEDQITIQWLTYVDEWGNKFPDGETYELIYPEVTIPESAFYVPIQSGGKDIPHSQVGVRLETTIGIYGTGLLDYRNLRYRSAGRYPRRFPEGPVRKGRGYGNSYQSCFLLRR